MKVATRFVKPINSKQENELVELMAEYPTRREWIRAHSIKLSAKGYNIDQIAEIHDIDRDTVAIWLNNWEVSGIEGLKDKPIIGRPSILNEKEAREVKQIAQDNPRSIKQIANEVLERVKKK
jgi:transposase